MYQNEPNSIEYVDGVFIADKKICNYDEYLKLKNTVNEENKDKLIITSLSFLGEIND